MRPIVEVKSCEGLNKIYIYVYGIIFYTFQKSHVFKSSTNLKTKIHEERGLK